MGTINSIYVIVGLVALLLGLIVTILRGVVVLWRISASLTTSQISLSDVQKGIVEINLTLRKTDERIDIVDRRSFINERDITTAFKRIDERREQSREQTIETKRELKNAIDEVKENCKAIQSQKRQVLG